MSSRTDHGTASNGHTIAEPIASVSMVERVAHAIRRRRFERTGRGSVYDASQLSENEVDDARAAIEAMRERDEPMLDAGTAVLWPYVNLFAPGSTAVAVWEAMIDAALAEPL